MLLRYYALFNIVYVFLVLSPTHPLTEVISWQAPLRLLVLESIPLPCLAASDIAQLTLQMDLAMK